MVTLREIAERVGCTRATVSYALRNRPDVSPGMRATIQRAAREMGWRPNAKLSEHMALVRTTTQKFTCNLAIISDLSGQPEVSASRQQLSGAVDRARALGYFPTVIDLGQERVSVAGLRRLIRARGIKGIIYIDSPIHGCTVEQLGVGEDLVSAVVGVRDPRLPYHVAVCDLSRIGLTAIRALGQRGFHRPGAIVPLKLDETLGWSFSGSMFAAQFELPPESRVPTLHVGRTEFHIPDPAFGQIADWISTFRPDVLLSTDARFLSKVLKTVALPFSPPPIASLDYFPGLPAIGGIDQRQYDVGQAGVDLVVAQLHRGEHGVPPVQRSVQIEGCWCDAEAATNSRDEERGCAAG